MSISRTSSSSLLPTLVAFALVVGLIVLGRGFAAREAPPSFLGEIDYLVDEQRDLTLDDVLARTDWQRHDGVPSFGLRSEPFWFRTQIANDEAATTLRHLELTYPILDSVEVWQLGASRSADRYLVSGDKLAFGERPVLHRHFVFPLELEPGQNTVVFRVQTDGSLQVPLRLWEPQKLLEFTETRSLIDGGFYGVLLVMVFYNLILFLGLRERTFLYYVGHVLTTGLFMASMSGLAFMHLWPNALWWQAHAVPVLISLSVVFISLFATSFLEIERRSVFGRIFMTLLVVAGVCCVGSIVLGPTVALLIASMLSISALSTAFAASVWGWFKGHRAARYLVIAWGGFILGSLALAFSKLGIVPSNAFSDHGMMIGSMMDVVFLSLAISERVRQERILRELAQERAMRLEQEARAGLETAVAERTQQLEDTMEQLSLANRRLEELSNQDGLTGLSNRRHFEEVLAERWASAQERDVSLCLLIADIDRFKLINDSFGHLTGDAVLRRVVAAMNDALTSSDHFSARLGGDEFVLLFEGDEQTAADVAESVRDAVAELEVHDRGEVLTVTVSIGATVAKPNRELPRDALERADTALYEAKERGRDRVVVRAEPIPA